MAADESFELRVKRLFGSHLLSSSTDSAGGGEGAAAWSVAAGEVERREWARPSSLSDADGDRGDTPCSSAFYDTDGCFAARGRRQRGRAEEEVDDDLEDDLEADLDELDEEDEAGREEGRGEGDAEYEENRIRGSIGLDPTLDHEEEEDAHDREAFGQDDYQERVYMRDIMDHGPHLSIHTMVPELYGDAAEETYHFSRDPRADRSAVNARLVEDDGLVKEGSDSASNVEPPQGWRPEVGVSVKPILKRKDVHEDSKPKKRVRFDSCYDDEQPTVPRGGLNSNSVPRTLDDTLSEKAGSSGVPDYIRNPSKYTCYTLDSSLDHDNKTNNAAFEDFLRLVRKRDHDETIGDAFELPSSVMFTPRKKTGDAMAVDGNAADSSSKATHFASAFAIGIAANHSHGACAVDMVENEDDEGMELETAVNSKRAGRHYRSKSGDDMS